jgi:hypothetical protein
MLRRDGTFTAPVAAGTVQRGGTISITGVYGSQADPLPVRACSTRV